MFPPETLSQEKFWQELFPAFSISENSLEDFSNSQIADLKELDEQIVNDGYIKLKSSSELSHKYKYSELISSLVSKGLLPVFCLIYDEFWYLQAQYKDVLARYLKEDFLMLPAAWAWHLDKDDRQAGWGPHRDRGWKSIDKDGKPLFLTLWIPLCDVDSDNGCIYVVPANQDKEYGTENDSNRNFELNSIRALDAKKGDALIWNQAILHWGGKANPRAKENRVSIGFEYQTRGIPDAKDIVLDPSVLPSFDMRLNLIARQIIQYMHMYSFDKNIVEFAKNILEARGVDLVKFIEDNSN